MSMYNLIENSDNYAKASLLCGNIVEINQKIIEQILNHLNLNQGL